MKLKGIDGGPHKRRNMWFNSMIREEPYPGLKVSDAPGDWRSRKGAKLGAAWLSSARAVRCWLKCHNERNPRPQLPTVRPCTLGGLPPQGARKAGMTSNQHGPYVRGHTRVTMARTEGSQAATPSQSIKARPSSDWGLQPDPTKLDSLVIAHQPWRGEYVPGPCTHRPSSHGSPGRLKTASASNGQGRNG